MSRETEKEKKRGDVETRALRQAAAQEDTDTSWWAEREGEKGQEEVC